jgi:hypothetical protein
MSRARLAALPCLLLVLVLGACGGSSASGGAEPAGAVPAGASLYVEGVVRPEGSQKEDVLDAAGKILRTDDPERRLHELVDQGLKESGSGDATYDKDIAPWLGKKAGVWVTGLNRAKPGYVVLVAATDTDKAQAAIDKGAKADGGKLRERSYSGVDYQLDSDGVAAGIVDDFVTVGTEAEFRRTIKAADGASLAEEKKYERTIERLDDDRVGLIYADLKPLLEQGLKSDPKAAGQLEQLRTVFSLDQLHPVGGALLADGDRIAFDSLTRGKGAGASGLFGPLTGSGSTPLVGELPGDAWVALGAPKVGPSVKQMFTRVAGAFGAAAAAQQLGQRHGITLDRDVFGWIGDVAVYARGTTRDDLEGALVIQATDPGAMRGAFGKLVGLVQKAGGQNVVPVRVKGAASAFRAGATDLGKPVVLARSEDRVVAAVGERAAAEALAPAKRLADSALYKSGQAILDDGRAPAFLLSMPAVLTLVETLGHPDADYAKARPYLQAFSVIAGGGSVKRDEARSRFAAGLK